MFERKITNQFQISFIKLFITAFFLILAVFSTFLVFGSLVTEQDIYVSLNGLILLFSQFFAIMLFIVCLFSKSAKMQQKIRFEIMVGTLIVAGVLNIVLNYTYSFREYILFNYFFDTVAYLLVAVYWMTFWNYQLGKVYHKCGDRIFTILVRIFLSVYLLLVLLERISETVFNINNMTVSSFNDVSNGFIFGFSIFWAVFYLFYVLTSKAQIKTKLSLSSYVMLPSITVILCLVFNDNDLIRGLNTSLLVFAYLFSIYLIFFNVYNEHNSVIFKKEKELLESRLNASVLQINPHFIANTLSSVVALCDIDAKKAAGVIKLFAKYLRDNYIELTGNPLIDFSTELENLKNYIAIEQVRFPEIIVEYNINAEHFPIPSLVLQPLVENAIKHGFCKTDKIPPKLTISSNESEDAFLVTVTDNGIGYKEKEFNDGRKHIGIHNSKTRLSLLCGGELKITGEENKGTVCEIIIPKEEIIDL